MRQANRWVDTEDDQAGANRQTNSLAALAILLFVVVVSVGLLHRLRDMATVQDCVMSGRTNCGVAVNVR